MLIKANKDAAAAFFSQAHLVAPLSAIVKLIGLLYKAVSKCIARGDRDAEDEEGKKKEFLLKPSDTDIMSTMLELAAIMWEKVKAELGKSENEPLQKVHYFKYLMSSISWILLQTLP